MKSFLIFLLAICFSHSAFSSACTNSNKNCVAIGAKKMYFYLTPVCEMKAECDSYCGDMNMGKTTLTFYCGLTKNEKCMDPSECEKDTSVIRSDDDLKKLSSYPYLNESGARASREGVK